MTKELKTLSTYEFIDLEKKVSYLLLKFYISIIVSNFHHHK
ncbi:MAG: hypothetical protein UR67_C0002G0009 [candidate division CPR3 bacterium GW2011_GWF2_35_18]|uniref:Uncharacterized protein n=1 Tax=candidate division CPR3 bacterium GW2011_GWF2_35_18 TaxID=1618350 RepID=A0A0G0BK68_UNCC3|nr:MAG: hypothetical protein UR67_C0002G0009 [candidate division CPR3 bacterium GW2011_GWF2_35_18]